MIYMPDGEENLKNCKISGNSLSFIKKYVMIENIKSNRNILFQDCNFNQACQNPLNIEKANRIFYNDRRNE